MKKNVMMRIASILLVCVLATTCGISGTFAKYVTEGSSSDTARVAKFGVKITADGDLFSDSYKDTATTYTVNEDGSAITVQANTEGTNVVAPGTEGSLAVFKVTGIPEVDVRVTYAATLNLTGWMIDHDNDVGTPDIEYCPIVITVNTTEYFIGKDASITNVATLKAAVEAAIEAITNDYDTNENLNQVNDDLNISWKWYFESTTTGNPLNAYQTNPRDTVLGNEAAAGDAANIELEITCTITQVD